MDRLPTLLHLDWPTVHAHCGAGLALALGSLAIAARRRE
jgi:hypothetical protein